ncbi:unnamed protein product [Discosporangium mesarthrocarpum]
MVARSFSSNVDYTVVNMPALSPTMERGTITQWHKGAGDELSAGDILCDVETDKATVAFDTQDEGILAKVIAEAGGAEVAVGDPVAIIVEDTEAFAAFGKADAAGSITLPAPGTKGIVETTPESGPAAAAGGEAVARSGGPQRTVAPEFLFAPSARHIAESKGIDASSLEGTGKEGRITKGDLIKALAQEIQFPPLEGDLAHASPSPAQTPSQAQAPTVSTPSPAASPVPLPPPSASTESYTDVPANNIRKVVAKRLSESKAIVPHHYASIACEVDNLMAFRKRLVQDHGVKVSVNDIVIRSAALALRDVPEANASWVKDGIQPGDTIDISVAVATPNGLITPIVTGADKRGLSGISTTVRDLATRAKDNKLKPEEFMGGSFTVSNLGMFGINEFSAVINMPQACILAVGGGVPTVKPGRGEGDAPRICSEVTVRLSCDRRVVDEAVAGQWLQAFKHYMETPELLLM